VKIGPVDTEIICLMLKKEVITEGKIYSPVGKFAERAEKCCKNLLICKCLLKKLAQTCSIDVS